MMRAVIVGAVESTRVAIEAFAESEWRLPLVVTLPADVARRHSDFVDLGKAAANAGSEVHYTKQVNDTSTLSAIEAARPDFIFVIGWSQICRQEFRKLLPEKIIGYHPGPIPRLRGRAVIPWTILLNEPVSAGTLFWIDEGIDCGPILAQQFFHVAPDETASTLYGKHMAALTSMMRVTLHALTNGTAQKQIQDERCATYAARRTREDGRIDWDLPAVQIDRLIRAVGHPYPGAFTHSSGERLTIWRSSFPTAPGRYHALPGQIVANNDGRLIVQTGDGLIQLDEWELEQGHSPAIHAILGQQT